MKAQSMAPTTVVLMIIGIVVIAVSAIFVFGGGTVGSNQTNQTTAVASGSQLAGKAKIDFMLAEQDCGQKCFSAQTAAKKYASCTDDYKKTDAKGTGFCNSYDIGGTPMTCAEVYSKKEKPGQCMLTFNWSSIHRVIVALGCSGTTPTC